MGHCGHLPISLPPKTSLTCKFPCLLKPSPSSLEWAPSFFFFFLVVSPCPSPKGPVSDFTLGKFSSLQTNTSSVTSDLHFAGLGTPTWFTDRFCHSTCCQSHSEEGTPGMSHLPLALPAAVLGGRVTWERTKEAAVGGGAVLILTPKSRQDGQPLPRYNQES